MNENAIVLVRGFDIYYENASKQSLGEISKNLGGRHSFNAEEGRATYMFESIKRIKIADLKNIHKFVNNLGEKLGIIHKCKYSYSELYVTCPKEHSNYLQSVLK
jgi:hypothetical protein